MPKLSLRLLKIFYFAIAVQLLQIFFFARFNYLPINLPLSLLLVFMSLLGLLENILLALLLLCFSCLYSYNSDFLWFYPLVAFLGVKLNPQAIADKFLILMIYTFVFSTVIELLMNHGFSFSKTLSAILANSICTIVLFFIVKFFYHDYKLTHVE